MSSMTEPCKVCLGTATEWLTFASQYRESRISLCAEHYQALKTIYDGFVIEHRSVTLSVPVDHPTVTVEK